MTTYMKTISKRFGECKLGENGLIYLYKADYLSIDKPMAEEILETLNQFGDDVEPNVIVIQGRHGDYNFDAMITLLNHKKNCRVAYVSETSAQYKAAEILRDLTTTLNSDLQVRLFQRLADAENWLLEA